MTPAPLRGGLNGCGFFASILRQRPVSVLDAGILDAGILDEGAGS